MGLHRASAPSIASLISACSFSSCTFRVPSTSSRRAEAKTLRRE
jgi:hypothetical protein